jgi:hypothetical protein
MFGAIRMMRANAVMRMIRMRRMLRMLGIVLYIMLSRIRHRMLFGMLFGGFIRRFGRMPVMVVFICHALTLCLRMVVVPVALPALAIMHLSAGRRFNSSCRSTSRPICPSNCTPAVRFATRASGNMRTVPVASIQHKWHCRH